MNFKNFISNLFGVKKNNTQSKSDKGFQPSEWIENPDLLFGRNKEGQLLDQLLNNVKRGTNCQLQGERRSGKTSTLKCLETKILKEHKNIIPVFLDFKEVSFVNGNANVYRYMIAKVIEVLSINNLFTTKLNVRSTQLTPNNFWEDSYGELSKIDDVKIQELLKGFLDDISQKEKVNFTFLIDEYEYLFLHSFDVENGFYTIRTLSQQSAKNDIKTLTFIIAGAKSWEKFGSEIGSAELNSIGAGILSVSPLELEDFEEMWKYYLQNIENTPYDSLINNIQDIYDLSGGIPFYGKVIAETALNQSQDIHFTILLSHFEEIYKNLDESERRIIKAIIDNKAPDSKPIKLVDRGILKVDGNEFKINGKLLNDYLIQKIKDVYVDERTLDLSNKVKEIQLLIREINQNSKNKKGHHIFEPTNEYAFFCQQIETICLEEDTFSNFTSAFYKILFEHTKNRQSLDKLPSRFKDKDRHPIIKVVDSLRHNFGGHDTSNPSFSTSTNQYTKSELLQRLLNNNSEPRGENFYKMQKKVIDDFLSYLTNLRNFVSSEVRWQ